VSISELLDIEFQFSKNVNIFFLTARTFARGNSEQTLNDRAINEAVIDGENVSFSGIGHGRKIQAIELRPPPPRNDSVPGHL
jgi:hypothetical protein